MSSLRTIGVLAAALAGVGVLGAGVRNAVAFEAVSLTDYSGAELFQRFCASCHGASARGDGPVAPTLATLPPNLTTISRRYGEFPAGLIRDTIDGRGGVRAHGARGMPVWGYEFYVEAGGDVNAEKEMHEVVKRLVEYLRSLQVDGDRADRSERR
jgi:mono/diheme cytochrome c family protein